MKFNETKSQERLINLMLQAGVEWPSGYKFAAQGGESGRVFLYVDKPKRDGLFWTGYVYERTDECNRIFDISSNPQQNWHQTIITREQYEARDGWITWHGGECPVAEGVLIDVKWHDGDIATFYAGGVHWHHAGNGSDIIDYRIHKPTAEQHGHVCESVEQTIPAGPTIEQLIAEYKEHRAAHAVQAAKLEKQREAVSEAEARMSEAAEAVEDALAEAGWIERKEPEQPIIDDWRCLIIGDVITVGGAYEGDGEGVVCDIDNDDDRQPVRVAFESSGNNWPSCIPEGDFKFIRRPSEVNHE